MHGDPPTRARTLAALLLQDVERIAERSVTAMQETLPSYARIPRRRLVPITLANTRNLLEAIRDPTRDPAPEQDAHQASGVGRARQGITSDEMLHAWRIGLNGVREAAYAIAEERGIGQQTLLEFVEAALRWGDAGMRRSAASHHEAELRELGQLTREQAALRRVATIVARERPADEIFATIAKEVALLLEADTVMLWRYEPGAAATLLAGYGDIGDPFTIGSRWTLEDGTVTARVYRTERPARFDAGEPAAGPLAAEFRRRGVRSAVGSPIFAGGRLWGVVGAASEGQPMPAEAETRIVAFTELAATAIVNAQTRAEAERFADEQAALRRVATLVARECPPEDLFAQVAEEVARLLGCESAGIWRYEPESGTGLVVGAWGTMARSYSVGSRVPLEGDTLSATVYRTLRTARFDGAERSGALRTEHGPTVGMHSATGSPILVGGRLWGVIVAGTSRLEALPADAESRIAAFTELVATAISNLQARDGVQRLARAQAALRRVATMVAREAPPQEVFAKVAEQVGLLLEVEGASIDRYEPDGGCTVVASWGRLRELFEVGSHWTLDRDSASALVSRTGRPIRLDGYERAWGPAEAGARRLGLVASVATPVLVDGGLWGAIFAATSAARPMPDDAERRIAQFTELVATAISNVQARADLSASRARVVVAADETRRRVVRDLHDGAQQRLVHTIVTLKLAHRALERDDADAGDLLIAAQRHAKMANAELRELAHGIVPSVLATGGLGAGVRSLASRLPIPVEVEVSVSRLPTPVEATAYFTVAEALTNVVKHSDARHAAVRAECAGGVLEVEVRDDGIGGAQADGPGLLGLRDRLASVDGRLRLECPAGGGTRLTAVIPVSPRPTVEP
jgi:signal transduction histidine kinase